MIKFVHKGSFKNTESFFRRAEKLDTEEILEFYGKQGVEALRKATPKDSGKTADSWSYEIVKKKNGYGIYWRNSHVNKGIPIAVLIQYGHATGTGGYVEGIDFINPAIKSTFDDIAERAWKEVTGNG